MEGERVTDPLYLQLHKLSAINSEQELDNILATLWNTRKTGLQSTEKSRLQSLFNLPSPALLDPVITSLILASVGFAYFLLSFKFFSPCFL